VELGDLAVEVPRHEALTQQFDAVHFRLCATSAVISAPSSPERAPEVFRRPQCLVARRAIVRH
jgi:tRNA A37 threonylcarbamoyladenosine synthetase subunit TsaC/SUA5/YrdC